jgi:hypothetical protein
VDVSAPCSPRACQCAHQAARGLLRVRLASEETASSTAAPVSACTVRIRFAGNRRTSYHHMTRTIGVYDGQYKIAYIDADNNKGDGKGHLLVWVQDDFSIHPLVSGNTTAITMIVRQSIDCRLDRVKSLSAQLYSPQGNIIVSLDLSDHLQRHPTRHADGGGGAGCMSQGQVNRAGTHRSSLSLRSSAPRSCCTTARISTTAHAAKRHCRFAYRWASG